MPRNQKNNADYFPHYNGMRNHRKIKMLRNKFGQVLGYAFWCMMLEWLTEHDGLEWEFSEIELEMFSAELGVSAAEIPPMVHYCLKIELLFKNDDSFIYSDSLNEYLNPVFEKRKKEREKSKTRQRREDGTFKNAKSTTSHGVSAAEIPHSKEEKRRVNKSKDIVASSESTKKPKTLHQLLCATWLEDMHPGWTFTAQNGKEIKSVAQKFKKLLISQNKEPKDQTISDAFKYMCLNLPEWYRDKDLSKINSSFNEIIEQIKNIKNGKSINSKQSQSKYAPTTQRS